VFYINLIYLLLSTIFTGIAQKENSPDEVQEPIPDVEIPTAPNNNLVPDSNMPTQAQVVEEESANNDPDHQMILELEEDLDHPVVNK